MVPDTKAAARDPIVVVPSPLEAELGPMVSSVISLAMTLVPRFPSLGLKARGFVVAESMEDFSTGAVRASTSRASKPCGKEVGCCWCFSTASETVFTADVIASWDQPKEDGEMSFVPPMLDTASLIIVSQSIVHRSPM